MNRQTQETINYVSKFLKVGEMKHLNCIRINIHDSDKHNDEIIRRCKEYLKLGIPYLTQVVFIKGGIADILKPTIPEIEEILVTETDERFEAKKYPFRTIAIRIK